MLRRLRGTGDVDVTEGRLRVATYNIHKGRGVDGRTRLERIVAVLAEIDADVVAIQEIFESQARVLADATGMRTVFGPTRRLAGGFYGNLCLSRVPLVGHLRYNLTCKPFEPRGCLRVDLDVRSDGGAAGPGLPLHLFNVHLGLNHRERARQVERLVDIFGRSGLAGPRLVLGDFNEWFRGGASRLLHAEFGHPNGRRRAIRTHPSPLPVFPLDRIYHDPGIRVVRSGVHRSRLARVASDHLPAFADLRLTSVPAAVDGAKA